MSDEARLEELDSGLAPVTDGWFVVNARDAAWQVHPGARPNGGIDYPRSELALQYEAGVETETDSPAEAYAPHGHWRPARPKGWEELPWARE